MDRSIEELLQRSNKRLEVTLEIILEHFKETDERIEELQKKIAELEAKTNV